VVVYAVALAAVSLVLAVVWIDVRMRTRPSSGGSTRLIRLVERIIGRVENGPPDDHYPPLM
jgi:hypothetical protein